MFPGFPKYYSVTNILLLTGLPSFDTLMINAKKSDAARWSASSNALVKAKQSKRGLDEGAGRSLYALQIT